MVTKTLFGKDNGTDVYAYTIENGNIKATLLEYGATLQSLYFDGVDCVLGYDDLAGYQKNNAYLGVTVGRYAGRISGSSFVLDDVEYKMDPNNGRNSCHGGYIGFSHSVFRGEQLSENAVRFHHDSPDGEGGYPGNLTVSVTFSVEDDTLTISYHAVSDKTTVLSLTNHSYFNLGAPDNRSTVLQIKGDRIIAVDEQLLPTGDLPDVEGTAFDFRTPRALGEAAKERGCGFDHSYVLGTTREYREGAGLAYCPDSGISMQCDTDMPTLHLYTADTLYEPCGKGGKPLVNAMAFCFETQMFVDAPNHPHFPSARLEAGQPYQSITKFRFQKGIK